MTAEIASRIAEITAGEVDWKALLELAAEHSVTPLLSRQLLSQCADALPAETSAALRAASAQIAGRNLQLGAEMLRLANRFRETGIQAVPYKGPLLAAHAYGNLALREFADLDFAIRQSDFPRAQALLTSEGYAATFGATPEGEAARPSHSDYPFFRAADSVIVELQTDKTLRYYPKPLNFDVMFGRLRQVSVGGQNVASFSNEETLIMLAVHGTKHFWERLMWIADIAELVQVEDSVAWPELFARAAEMRVQRMVKLALYISREMLDAPLPGAVLEKLQGDPATKRIGDGIRARFLQGINGDLPVFSRFRFRLATSESFWRGIPYALRLATTTTDSDREDVPLPGKFSKAHTLLRPFLLMRRYGVRRQQPVQSRKHQGKPI